MDSIDKTVYKVNRNMPEGLCDSDEADGLPDEQDPMMFSATDEGGQEEEHEQE